MRRPTDGSPHATVVQGDLACTFDVKQAPDNALWVANTDAIHPGGVTSAADMPVLRLLPSLVPHPLSQATSPQRRSEVLADLVADGVPDDGTERGHCDHHLEVGPLLGRQEAADQQRTSHSQGAVTSVEGEVVTVRSR